MELQSIAAILLIISALSIFLLLQTRKETSRLEMLDAAGKPVFVDAELADTAAKRMKGLMFRERLAESEGMLFVFGDEDYRKFWMMNTTIPLDAIFFASDGTVVEIIQMEPCASLISCKTYQSSARARYVLEVNRGFAKENGIEAGKSRGIGFPG